MAMKQSKGGAPVSGKPKKQRAPKTPMVGKKGGPGRGPLSGATPKAGTF